MIRKLFSAKPFSIERKVEPNDELPYGGFFVFVSNGKGRIKSVYKRSDKNEDYYSYLLVNDIPVLSWQEENGCPTCDQIIKAGNNDFDSNEVIKNINEVTFESLKSDSEWVTTYFPLLEQFETGLYFVTCNKYYPTDGEGKLFWGTYNTPTVSKAINYGFWNEPKYRSNFIIASQSTNKFSNDRFEDGKNSFKTNPGITYHLGGFMSVLLDGHHRALAAATLGDFFECITIARAFWYWKGGNHDAKLPDGVASIFKQDFEAKALSFHAQQWLKKAAKNHGGKEATDHHDFEVNGENKKFNEIVEGLTPQLKKYPTIDFLSAVAEANQISDEDIENAYKSETAYPPLETVLMALVGATDERARPLALRILKDDNWQKLWSKSLNFLSQFKDQEVLDLFWDFEVRSDIKRRDVLDIVNQYVEKNSDSYS